jgi:hypothetical protein
VLATGLLASCLLRRPLVYLAARRTGPDWDRRWAAEPGVRHTFTVLTAGWGLGLLAEAAVRVPLVFALPADTMVGLSTLLQLAAVAGLLLWSVRYVRHRRSASTGAAAVAAASPAAR